MNNKYIFDIHENIPLYTQCGDYFLVPISDIPGPQGPQGPRGSSINIGNTGSGSVLVINPDNKETIYYNNLLKVNNNIVTGTNIIPSNNLEFSLGSTGARWKEIYMGPGTLNILGPDQSGNATLGADSNGIAYTKSGFATPFINIGPSQLIPNAVGGWNVSRLEHNSQSLMI